MKQLSKYIFEALKISSSSKVNNYHPDLIAKDLSQLYSEVKKLSDEYYTVKDLIEEIKEKWGVKRISESALTREVFNEADEFYCCNLPEIDDIYNSNSDYAKVTQLFHKVWGKNASYTDYLTSTYDLGKSDDGAMVTIWFGVDKNEIFCAMIEDEDGSYNILCMGKKGDENNKKRHVSTKKKITSLRKRSDGYYHPKNKEELNTLVTKILNKNREADLNDIDVSNITDLSNLYMIYANPNVSNWDVSNVKNMTSLFSHSRINCNLSNWDVSNVENMSNMFSECQSSLKNCKIENWDVSNVKDMMHMFAYSDVDNLDLSKWNPKNVEPYTIISMFAGTKMENNPPKWWKDIYKKHILNNPNKDNYISMEDDRKKYDKIATS